MNYVFVAIIIYLAIILTMTIYFSRRELIDSTTEEEESAVEHQQTTNPNKIPEKPNSDDVREDACSSNRHTGADDEDDELTLECLEDKLKTDESIKLPANVRQLIESFHSEFGIKGNSLKYLDDFDCANLEKMKKIYANVEIYIDNIMSKINLSSGKKFIEKTYYAEDENLDGQWNTDCFSLYKLLILFMDNFIRAYNAPSVNSQKLCKYAGSKKISEILDHFVLELGDSLNNNDSGSYEHGLPWSWNRDHPGYDKISIFSRYVPLFVQTWAISRHVNSNDGKFNLKLKDVDEIDRTCLKISNYLYGSGEFEHNIVSIDENNKIFNEEAKDAVVDLTSSVNNYNNNNINQHRIGLNLLNKTFINDELAEIALPWLIAKILNVVINKPLTLNEYANLKDTPSCDETKKCTKLQKLVNFLVVDLAKMPIKKSLDYKDSGKIYFSSGEILESESKNFSYKRTYRLIKDLTLMYFNFAREVKSFDSTTEETLSSSSALMSQSTSATRTEDLSTTNYLTRRSINNYTRVANDLTNKIIKIQHNPYYDNFLRYHVGAKLFHPRLGIIMKPDLFGQFIERKLPSDNVSTRLSYATGKLGTFAMDTLTNGCGIAKREKWAICLKNFDTISDYNSHIYWENRVMSKEIIDAWSSEFFDNSTTNYKLGVVRMKKNFKKSFQPKGKLKSKSNAKPLVVHLNDSLNHSAVGTFNSYDLQFNTDSHTINLFCNELNLVTNEGFHSVMVISRKDDKNEKESKNKEKQKENEEKGEESEENEEESEEKESEKKENKEKESKEKESKEKESKEKESKEKESKEKESKEKESKEKEINEYEAKVFDSDKNLQDKNFDDLDPDDKNYPSDDHDNINSDYDDKNLDDRNPDDKYRNYNNYPDDIINNSKNNEINMTILDKANDDNLIIGLGHTYNTNIDNQPVSILTENKLVRIGENWVYCNFGITSIVLEKFKDENGIEQTGVYGTLDSTDKDNSLYCSYSVIREKSIIIENKEAVLAEDASCDDCSFNSENLLLKKSTSYPLDKILANELLGIPSLKNAKKNEMISKKIHGRIETFEWILNYDRSNETLILFDRSSACMKLAQNINNAFADYVKLNRAKLRSIAGDERLFDYRVRSQTNSLNRANYDNPKSDPSYDCANLDKPDADKEDESVNYLIKVIFDVTHDRIDEKNCASLLKEYETGSHEIRIDNVVEYK